MQIEYVQSGIKFEIPDQNEGRQLPEKISGARPAKGRMAATAA
jgi:hypothetical protein